jgi:molybdopterin-guanine dinucleotide biosynthesis protein A
MTGIILSGGKNRRMGTNKAFLKFEGERLIDRTVRLFRDLFSEVIVVTNAPLDYLDLKIQVVTDIVKGKGSLGGIYTGLLHAAFPHAFVAPCDMPFLNRDFIAAMIAQTANYDIVVPELPEGYQPLHAIYSKRCLPVIRKLIMTDQLKITGFYKGFRILALDEQIIRPFDPRERMFLNINSQEDLRHLA